MKCDHLSYMTQNGKCVLGLSNIYDSPDMGHAEKKQGSFPSPARFLFTHLRTLAFRIRRIA